MNYWDKFRLFHGNDVWGRFLEFLEKNKRKKQTQLNKMEDKKDG